MLNTNKIYDIAGIGIGPFNLGLAALCYSLPHLECIFVDKQKDFNWHPGMMIEGTRMQIPFYADLVSLAQPDSPFNYLCYLKAKKKMFRFAIAENYFIRRTEYNDYCRWVAAQLPSLKFDTECRTITKENDLYKVETNKGFFLTKHIVLGIGTEPSLPGCAKMDHEYLFHSSEYMYEREKLLSLDSIAIVGSGQSAAEIFYDLLQRYNGKLDWFTRSSFFFPMDYSKLNLEMSTPDYIDHFYSLGDDGKRTVLSRQSHLYKGINQELISHIYDLLAEKDSPDSCLHSNCELLGISSDLTLHFTHRELQQSFTHTTNAVILATGYQHANPCFLQSLKPFLQQPKRNYSIDEKNRVFIQHAELPSHGFAAADLSLGPYRNAVILNSILGYEHFELETNVCFQQFGLQ